MTKGKYLQQKLSAVLDGQPWYGRPVYEIIDSISFEAAFEKPSNNAHNIAEILLHMISWQEEIIDRMNEKPTGVPLSGDWPETGDPSEEKWQRWKDDFKLVNVNLLGIIQNFPKEKWIEPIIDERGTEPITSYQDLINGAIQHLVYHAGQIALLAKIINS